MRQDQSGVTPESDFSALSKREREVLTMATAGLADKQIGQELGVSINTLRTYWDRIREKVGDGSRSALVSAYTATEVKRLSPGARVLDQCGLVIDLNTMMVDASDEVCAEHGFEPGSLHSLEEYAALLHREDRKPVMSVLRDLIDGKTRFAHVVCRCMARNKERVLSYLFHVSMGEEGVPDKIYGYRTDNRDVRSGMRGRVRVGYYERWSDSDELFLDDEARLIHGFEPGENVRRQDLIAQLHPDDQERIASLYSRMMETDGDRIEGEANIVQKNGKLVPVKIVIRGIRHPDGRVKVIGTVTAVYD